MQSFSAVGIVVINLVNKCKGCGDDITDPKDRAWIDAPFCILCCCERCCGLEDDDI